MLFYEDENPKKYNSVLSYVSYCIILLNIVISILAAVYEGLNNSTSNTVGFDVSFILLIVI